MKMDVSKPTIGLSVFIIVSSLFMNQVAKFIEDIAGKRGEEVIMGALLLIGLAFFVGAMLKKGPFTVYSALCILILMSGLILAWQIKNPAERIHVIEYGILGWLASRDFINRKDGIRGFLKACLFGLAIGVLDEMAQWILPYRVFDMRDIAFNGSGVLWGAIIFGIDVFSGNGKSLS